MLIDTINNKGLTTELRKSPRFLNTSIIGFNDLDDEDEHFANH